MTWRGLQCVLATKEIDLVLLELEGTELDQLVHCALVMLIGLVVLVPEEAEQCQSVLVVMMLVVGLVVLEPQETELDQRVHCVLEVMEGPFVKNKVKQEKEKKVQFSRSKTGICDLLKQRSMLRPTSRLINDRVVVFICFCL